MWEVVSERTELEISIPSNLLICLADCPIRYSFTKLFPVGSQAFSSIVVEVGDDNNAKAKGLTGLDEAEDSGSLSRHPNTRVAHCSSDTLIFTSAISRNFSTTSKDWYKMTLLFYILRNPF